jgi:3-phosphoshikimate 1-carboxyvinyltransferase
VVVEGDYSAVAYFAAGAALTAGEVSLRGLATPSAQGDRRFLELLERMGAGVETRVDVVRVTGPARLEAIDVDMRDLPDQVPTLAALAPFARGVTRIRGVPHLRLKESDRLAAMALELGRLGAEVRERPEGLEIPGVWAERPPPDDSVTVDSHDDHRVAMSLAVLGLRRGGVRIDRPQVVRKSFPEFWDLLGQLISGDAPGPQEAHAT